MQTVAPDRAAGAATWGGLLVLVASAALYGTGLSRAVGVAIAPLGLLLLVGGLWTRRHGGLPHRALLAGVAALAVTLVVLGLWLLGVALTTEDTASQGSRTSWARDG